MKNFLAVDTSSDYLTVIAVKDGKTTSTYIPDCAMRHSVTLMNAVDETLKHAELTLSECDFFAVSVGAGSFTGIRIGISAVKGFALACQKPTLPVTSFDVVAYNSVEAGKRLCLINALHDAYYVCGYDGLEICYPPAYVTEEEVLKLCSEGYALVACSAMPVGEKAELKIVSPETGLLKAVQGKSDGDNFGELVALYVRKSSAELNLNA